MSKFRFCKNHVVYFVLSLLVFALPLSTKASTDDQLLKMIPENTYVCVRINNFDNALAQLDQFLAGASPMGVSMLVRMQLMNMLGSPQMTGLDTNGDISLVVSEFSPRQTTSDPAQNIFVGILVPVTDYSQFIQGNQNVSESDDRGISQIGQFGSVVQVGNCALVSGTEDSDRLIAFSQQLSNSDADKLISVLDSSETNRATTEPVWIYVNMQKVSNTFGPVVLGAMEQMQTVMQSMPAGQAGMSVEGIGNILNVYTQIVESLLKETRSVSLTINPKADALYISNVVSANPGTDMAKMFVSEGSATPNNKLLSFLEDGAIMNYHVNINSSFMKQMQKFSLEIISNMAGDNNNTEATEQLTELSEEVLNNIDGPIMYSILSESGNQPPFAANYAFAIKDEEQFDGFIERAVELLQDGGIMDFYNNLGIETDFTVNRDSDSYQGIPIDSAKFTMSVDDSLAGSQQAQMMNSMYGDGLEYRWAITDGYVVASMGGDADAKIRKLIDNVKSDSPNIGSEYKSALSVLPQAQNADFVMTFNILRVLEMVTAMVPMPLPEINTQSQTNIVMAGKADDGTLKIDMALPKEHLMEIMGAVMGAQQQMMMQQQPPQ